MKRVHVSVPFRYDADSKGRASCHRFVRGADRIV
jgi:hypothetical protein